MAFTLGARNRAEEAQRSADSAKAYTEETVDKALNEANKATSGSGAGPNKPVPAEGGNPLPNANGQ